MAIKAKADKAKTGKTTGKSAGKRKGIAKRYSAFLHSGAIFSFVTWAIQVGIEFFVVYGLTLMGGVYIVPLIVNAFVVAASASGRSEMFWVPTAFVVLVLALVMVHMYRMLWHALTRRFDVLRNKRADQLREKYGEEQN